jgi:hypothetical protein
MYVECKRVCRVGMYIFSCAVFCQRALTDSFGVLASPFRPVTRGLAGLAGVYGTRLCRLFCERRQKSKKKLSSAASTLVNRDKRFYRVSSEKSEWRSHIEIFCMAICRYFLIHSRVARFVCYNTPNGKKYTKNDHYINYPGHKVCQHFPFQDRPKISPNCNVLNEKLPKLWFFGIKIYHLATLRNSCQRSTPFNRHFKNFQSFFSRKTISTK